MLLLFFVIAFPLHLLLFAAAPMVKSARVNGIKESSD